MVVTSFVSAGPMFPEEVGLELNGHGARETALKFGFPTPMEKAEYHGTYL